MKCFLRSVVTLVLLAQIVLIGGSIELPDTERLVAEKVAKFLSTILTDHSGGSVGGVCFFGNLARWWREVQDFLPIRYPPGGRILWRTQFIAARQCETPELCSTALWVGGGDAWKCEVVVVALTQKHLGKHLETLSNVPFWTASAVHVFVLDATRARERDHQLTELLATFGITRSLYVQAKRDSSFEVHFPILFQRRVVPVSPLEASHRWLQNFDQLANLHGFQYRTLYHTLIPYLYRYDGVFGGPDYHFLQTALERQNATHLWIYHKSTDTRLNSTDLQYVDRKLLEWGRVTFSLNRLMVGHPSSQLEKLYLNSFDGTCVMVPRRQLQTFILRLWEPFSQYLWYAVLLIALLTIVGNVALPKLFVVNYLLALLFGSAIVEYRLAALDRTILLILDILLFLLREAYTAKIITYMIQIRYEPELQTMAELAQSGPPLLLAPGEYDKFAETLASMKPSPRFEIRQDFSSFATTWQEYFRPGFAHLVPCSYGQALVLSDEMNEPSAPKFYLLRERLSMLPEAFTFSRNSPFIGKLGFFVASLQEAGIYGSWLRSDHYARDYTPTLDEILRFENLASLFYVLLVGYVASMVVFVAERLVAKVRASLSRKRLRVWAKRARIEAGTGNAMQTRLS
ncbi:hypothetical protein ZHAS_00017323 [Anopheles sinensis]|uniref:Ionotropic receptor n=1 Tax=Anopheles sinensis TaxID=74873 RepID=A0A084WG21_ANOSI|nr:hypothetical protein ZHAS_00017323 [Anopheles sinensis]